MDELPRLRVAGQRPRAAELHRARGHPHRRRHDSRAASEPVVSRAAPSAGAAKTSPWAQIDLSGTLADATRARGRRGRAAEDRAGARRRPAATAAAAAEILQIELTRRCIAKLKDHGLESQAAYFRSPTVFSARLHLLLRHVVDDRRRADGGRQDEVQRAGDDLLVVLHRLEHLRRRRRRRSAAADRGWR